MEKVACLLRIYGGRATGSYGSGRTPNGACSNVGFWEVGHCKSVEILTDDWYSKPILPEVLVRTGLGPEILRELYLFRFQQVHPLRECRVCRYSPKVTEYLIRRDIDAFEEQKLPGEAQAHAYDRPIAIPHIGLLHQEMAALV